MLLSYQAIIFDCDGTLTDSMPTHYRAWHKIMAQFGVEFPEHRFYELAGVPSRKVAQIISREAGIQLDLDRVIELREQEFEKFADQITPHPGVIQIANEFRQRIPIAIGSGSVRRSVIAQLTGLGIVDWFSAIVTAEDTQQHKPEPDVFLEAARRLDVPPETCCVYEDGDMGIEAARRAGMDVVDVRPMISAAMKKEDPPSSVW